MLSNCLSQLFLSTACLTAIKTYWIYAGGDCKTLMIVQISPSSVDLGETLCSLNFASRVRGVEHGPARKQSDLTELFKYKQLVCRGITFRIALFLLSSKAAIAHDF